MKFVSPLQFLHLFYVNYDVYSNKSPICTSLLRRFGTANPQTVFVTVFVFVIVIVFAFVIVFVLIFASKGAIVGKLICSATAAVSGEIG